MVSFRAELGTHSICAHASEMSSVPEHSGQCSSETGRSDVGVTIMGCWGRF